MSFTNALNKAIELAFDKKENVDPKDPANWFTMNGTHVLDDGDNRAESATSFIGRKENERKQGKIGKSVYHRTFGDGTVVGVTTYGYKVKFDNGKTADIMSSGLMFGKNAERAKKEETERAKREEVEKNKREEAQKIAENKIKATKQWLEEHPNFTKEDLKQKFLEKFPDAGDKGITEVSLNDDFVYVRTYGGFFMSQPADKKTNIDGLEVHINPSHSEIDEYKSKKKKEKREKSTNAFKEQKDYEILEERPKALKLKKDGVEFWIKKSSIREDGSLKPAAIKEFEASKKGEGFLDKKKSENEERKQFKDYLNTNGVNYGSASWESDKAIGIDIPVDWYDIEKTQRVRIFLPKSQLKEGRAPWWLVQKKLVEMEKELDFKRSRLGGYSYDTPFTTDYDGGREYSSYGWWDIDRGAD